jgi:hypothetical protein
MAVTFDPGRDHFASQNVEAGQVDGSPIDMCFMDQLSSFDESVRAASGPLEACPRKRAKGRARKDKPGE